MAASADDDARIALAYERLYGRAVTDAEREIARGLLAGERQQGADDTRAWTVLCRCSSVRMSFSMSISAVMHDFLRERL